VKLVPTSWNGVKPWYGVHLLGGEEHDSQGIIPAKRCASISQETAPTLVNPNDHSGSNTPFLTPRRTCLYPFC
jgi:hypothetical protein